MYPRLSGYCSFSQCQWYQLQCQFAIYSSLKGNRLPHLSPVLAESLFAWPCHGSWCTWPAMQLKTDELRLNLLGLPFLLQGSSHEVFQQRWQTISQWLCSQASQGFLMTPPGAVGLFYEPFHGLDLSLNEAITSWVVW